jgi:hypothetical protein
VYGMSMVARRDKRVQMLFSQEEWAMLQTLAETTGITASDWVRLRVREAYGKAHPLVSGAKKGRR